MGVKAAKSTVYLSHSNRDPVKAAEFLSRVLYHIVYEAMPLEDALQAAADSTNDKFISEKLAQAQAKVAEATNPSKALSKQEFADDLAITSMARLWDVGKTEPIKVGKASPTEGTLPGALYFIFKYRDLKKASVANAMVGGDNASRAVAIGMVLGAKDGVESIPAAWKSTLNHWKTSDQLLDKLPLLRAASADSARRREL